MLLGIAGTAAGAGAGSAHLAKTGLDVAAVLAAIVLVTGIVLLAWGAAALVRAVPAGGGCWLSRTRPGCPGSPAGPGSFSSPVGDLGIYRRPAT